MEYLYIKALHIIFITTWFAGLFYVVRLFIYFKEAEDKPKEAQDVLIPQYALMIKRLWLIITWPSAILATTFAVYMLILQPGWMQQGWMHIKLLFVVCLFAYQLYCHKLYRQTQRHYLNHSSKFLRMWNEIATVILFACVFLVILKTALEWIYGVIGILVISILLMLGINFYNSIRKKNDWDQTNKS